MPEVIGGLLYPGGYKIFPMEMGVARFPKQIVGASIVQQTQVKKTTYLLGLGDHLLAHLGTPRGVRPLAARPVGRRRSTAELPRVECTRRCPIPLT